MFAAISFYDFNEMIFELTDFILKQPKTRIKSGFFVSMDSKRIVIQYVIDRIEFGYDLQKLCRFLPIFQNVMFVCWRFDSVCKKTG